MKLHKPASIVKYIKAVNLPPASDFSSKVIPLCHPAKNPTVFRISPKNLSSISGQPVPTIEARGQTIQFIGQTAIIYELYAPLIEYATQHAKDDDPRLGKESFFDGSTAEQKIIQVKLMQIKAAVKTLNEDPTLHKTLVTLRNECIRQELIDEFKKMEEEQPPQTTIKDILNKIKDRFGTTERHIRNIRSTIADPTHPLFVPTNTSFVTANGKPKPIRHTTNSTQPPLPINIKTDPRYKAVNQAVQRTRTRIANEQNTPAKSYKTINTPAINTTNKVFPYGQFSIYDVFPRVRGDRAGPTASPGDPLPLTTTTFPPNSEPYYPRSCPVTGIELKYEVGKGISNVRVWRLRNDAPIQAGNVTIMSALATRLIEGTMAIKTMYEVMNDTALNKWVEWQRGVR